MPAIASIKVTTLDAPTVLTVDAATGFNKTFVPDGFVASGVARWVDQSGGIPVGFPSFHLSMRRPNKDFKSYRVTAKVELPVLEVPGSVVVGFDPPPTKAYSLLANLEFILPERSTATQRQQLLSLVKSFLATNINASDNLPTDATGSPLYAAVVSVEQPY